ncbi:MAG TPA: hypothetical protein VIA18_27155, partial [Polyangia bacterium]|nr:hypothetical protein [Polyangia bacterium]
DDNDWRHTIALLVDEALRFGVNWLLLPERLPMLEAHVLELVALGCRDVLLLSYNGPDRALHLSPAEAQSLATRVARLHRVVGRRARLSLDVCWGERMERVPRHFDRADCGAGRDFIVLTSDKRMMACSFHHASFPIHDAADVMAAWRDSRAALAAPSTIAGCARRADYGLSTVTLAKGAS